MSGVRFLTLILIENPHVPKQPKMNNSEEMDFEIKNLLDKLRTFG